MEVSILNSTKRYAGCALLALALNHSQNRQVNLSNSLSSLDGEPVGEDSTASTGASVSDRPNHTVHENSGLLLPICKFMGVDDPACEKLREIAGSSLQIRHHLDAFLKLLSEESAPDPLETVDKELALVKSVDAIVLSEVDCDNSAACNTETKEGKCNGPDVEKHSSSESHLQNVGNPIQDGVSVDYRIKMTVLHELLSACLLSNKESGDNSLNLKSGYDSRHRVALRLMATWLDIEWIKVEALELAVASHLIHSQKWENSNKGDTAQARWKRGAIIGGAALAGGTLLALTGGLAAPAIAQGIGVLTPTLQGVVPAVGAASAAAATAVGSVGGSVAVAASFGAAGAGLSGSKVAKRLGGIEEFEFKAVGENHNQGRLAVGILVPGVAFEEEDFVTPWDRQIEKMERYTVKWESKFLIEFSVSIRQWLTSTLKSQAFQWGAMMTALHALVTAVAIPASLLTALDVIDSNWAMAVDRSDKAGKLLADALLEGHHGNRPVTLIGFSAGARVIFKCLQCLAETEGDNAGLVERVVLLGAPISIKEEGWELARKMVAGRFVNAYSVNDWTLGLAFRAQLRTSGLAGIQSVDTPGIENVDVTDIVETHCSYLSTTEQILEQLKLESCNPIPETAFKCSTESKDSTSAM